MTERQVDNRESLQDARMSLPPYSAAGKSFFGLANYVLLCSPIKFFTCNPCTESL